MIDNATGAVVLVGPEGAGPVTSSQTGPDEVRRARVGDQPADLPQRRAPGAPPPRRPARRSA
jgi:hypothetical protein